MKGKVLVAGFATRHVVQSAFRAGYQVIAVDHFCDQDLCWYTKDRRIFEELDEIVPLIEEICAAHTIDILVVTSGAEDIATSVPVCGTPRERVRKFLDKLEIQRFFEENKIPVPGLILGDNVPCMIKPRKGAGGWRNRMVKTSTEKNAWIAEWPDTPFVCQEIAEGTPCSVSCVTNGTIARAITTNEQLLRNGGIRKYGFSGAITPFDHPSTHELIRFAEEAAAASGCIGSVGVDFVMGEDIWAIEFNPRFQATLDTVEMATGCNLFELHVQACRGKVPLKMPEHKRFAVRKILFAEKDLVVRDDISHLAPLIADIPWVGTELEEDNAVVSVYGCGETRTSALAMLDKTIKKVGRYMCRW